MIAAQVSRSLHHHEYWKTVDSLSHMYIQVSYLLILTGGIYFKISLFRDHNLFAQIAALFKVAEDVG